MLTPDRNIGGRAGQLPRHRLEILEAAEKRQIVTRRGMVLPGDEPGERRDRAVPVAEAGRYVTHDPHTQLLRVERRAHLDGSRVLRKSQYVPVEVERSQGRRKQHAAMRCGPPRRKKTRRNSVAQTQGSGWRVTGLGRRQAQIADGIAVEIVRQATELDRPEIEVEQLGGHPCGWLGGKICDVRYAALEAAQQWSWGRLIDPILCAWLCRDQRVPVPDDLLDVALYVPRRRTPRREQHGAIQLRGEHRAPPLHQVVRFVHENGYLPLVRLGQCI